MTSSVVVAASAGQRVASGGCSCSARWSCPFTAWRWRPPPMWAGSEFVQIGTGPAVEFAAPCLALLALGKLMLSSLGAPALFLVIALAVPAVHGGHILQCRFAVLVPSRFPSKYHSAVASEVAPASFDLTPGTDRRDATASPDAD